MLFLTGEEIRRHSLFSAVYADFLAPRHPALDRRVFAFLRRTLDAAVAAREKALAEKRRQRAELQLLGRDLAGQTALLMLDRLNRADLAILLSNRRFVASQAADC